MMLKHDGSVYATGDNEHGQLGDGTKNNRLTFVMVESGQCYFTGTFTCFYVNHAS